MESREFEIEFSYQGISYVGLVTPLESKNGNTYRVNLESDNQESYVEIIAKQSRSELEDWDFECMEGEPATDYYDKDLLLEIGEAIEKVIPDEWASAK